MADPLHSDDQRPLDRDTAAVRDSKIEQLLLAGLDDYFAGEYERAVSVWTRVLFLDRTHARARAYIERARSAIAERLRESEELLHSGVAAFDRGEADAARRLLTSAVERGGPQEIALAFLERLERLEPTASSTAVPVRAAGSARPARLRRRSGPGRARIRWVLPVTVLTAIVAAAGYVAVTWGSLGDLFGINARWGRAAAAAAAPESPLPVPSPAEFALARARGLGGAGRLREALRVLEQVPLADPLRPEADRMREAIQRALLTGAPVGFDDVSRGLAPGSTAPPGPARER